MKLPHQPTPEGHRSSRRLVYVSSSPCLPLLHRKKGSYSGNHSYVTPKTVYRVVDYTNKSDIAIFRAGKGAFSVFCMRQVRIQGRFFWGQIGTQ